MQGPCHNDCTVQQLNKLCLTCLKKHCLIKGNIYSSASFICQRQLMTRPMMIISWGILSPMLHKLKTIKTPENIKPSGVTPIWFCSTCLILCWYKHLKSTAAVTVCRHFVVRSHLTRIFQPMANIMAESSLYEFIQKPVH